MSPFMRQFLSCPFPLIEDKTDKSEHARARAFWIKHREEATGECNSEFFGGEFDKLLQDPRVNALNAGPEYIEVLTSVIHERFPAEEQGKARWYLGTYLISIRPRGLAFEEDDDPSHPTIKEGFEVLCVNSGRHDLKPRHIYTQPAVNGFPGGFCFGERNPVVANLVQQREWFALIMIVLESLAHVNDSEVDRLDEYRRVTDVFLGEGATPVWGRS